MSGATKELAMHIAYVKDIFLRITLTVIYMRRWGFVFGTIGTDSGSSRLIAK